MKSEPIRTVNQFEILNTIRIAGAISRVEIARITGQSRGTVTNITARLIQENLIYEKEIEDTVSRGRNRILLALHPNAAFVVGVKVSAFRIGCAVTDIQADLKSSIIMPVRTSERPAGFVADLIEEGIRHCVSEARLSLSQISGIGIGIPGFVDSRQGICQWTPLYQPGEVQLRELIQQRFNIDTFVENDANTVTLAQLWTGEGRGVDHFIVVTIEDGVGMGIVVDGELYRGSKGLAGELGHLVVNPAGVTCRCGKKGCIEAYASNFAIVEAARRACLAHEWSCADPADITYEKVLAAARGGHPALRQIFSQAGFLLGLGLAGLFQIFNPSKLIITGNGIRAGNLLFDSMRAAIAQNTNPGIRQLTEIVILDWRDIDWSLGAACLALQELYKSPIDRAQRSAVMKAALEKRSGAKADSF